MTPFGQPAVFRLEVEVQPPEPLDLASAGPVRLIAITGGRVTGAIAGRILAGGADWQTIQPDGTIDLEARYLLELDDGSRIELQSRGRRGATASEFWSTIWLRTPDARHAQLNRQQYLGRGRKQATYVEIEAFAFP